MKIINRIIFFLISALAVSACIEDGFTSSPADQPDFSIDTLKMGLLLTEEGSPTANFIVYNRASKGISISDIALEGENAAMFRLNVDGLSGKDFHNVEIRANDSIFVMVEARLPQMGSDLPVDVEARIRFNTNGQSRSVVLTAQGQDVTRLRGHIVDSDTRFRAGKPYQIYDSLVVKPGATLTLEAGTRLYFHDGAYMRVAGSLHSLGTVDNHVDMTGDRTDNVLTDVSFDIMSRQWGGIIFTEESNDNILSHTDMRNTWFGIMAVGDGSTSVDKPMLTLRNSRLHNSGENVLTAIHASVVATGCEFAEASYSLVDLRGGQHRFDHCTLANYYLFTAIGGASLQLSHLNNDSDDESGLPYTEALFTNSIIYGLGSDISHGDLSGTSVTLNTCLLRSDGSNDDNFINCIWNEDPLYNTVREDYYFDYRLQADSPARGVADTALALPESAIDYFGITRQGAIGAYEALRPETDGDPSRY